MAATEASAATVSRKNLQRAEAILRSIVAELEQPQKLEDVLTEEERESLQTLQSMLDVVQSPLFTAVVHITERCRETIVESEKWNEAADVKATAEDVVAQFKERYRIPSVSRSSSSNPANTDNLLDDTTITSPSNDPDPVVESHHQHASASVLNMEPQRTPSLSSCDSFGSNGSRRNRGKKIGKGLTLAHLARDTSQPQGDIPLMAIPGQSPPPAAAAVAVVQPVIRDVSLSSLTRLFTAVSSHEASPPPLPLSLPPPDNTFSTTPPSTGADQGLKRDVKGGVQAKDLLFFMRDEESMRDVRTTLNGRWGRDPREVKLPPSLSPSPPNSIGIELCGLSSTGVYVSDVTLSSLEDRLQAGDQVLEVNGQPIDNMAWFEVTQLILKSSGACLPSHQPGSGMEQREEQEENEVEENGQSVETCTLLVQYNPAGLGEVKRLDTRTRT